MMNKKIKIFSLLLSVAVVYLWISMAQVQLNPIYSSDRFQPSDKFHAGCENQMDVVFDLEGSEINGINAILKYNNQDIDIIKIVAEWEKENNLSYVIEEDKIIFNKLKTENQWWNDIVFRLFFEVDENLDNTDFSFVEGSYVLDDNGVMNEINESYQFNFAKVPECNPDIAKPHVNLIFPDVNTGEYVALDSYFEFNIFDEGKWINKESISISIDDVVYDLSSIEHERNGENLTIYPDVWLPLNAVVKLEILVWDKQVYWKSNIINKTYNLRTSRDLYLLNDIDPVEFRKLVDKEKYYQGSLSECSVLSKIYVDLDWNDQKLLQSIAKRLSCGDITQIEDTVVVNTGVVDDLVLEEIMDFEDKKVSILSMLGWILFVFVLIISGILCYKRK